MNKDKTEVSKEEFDKFISNYPRTINKSGYNWTEVFNDFTLGDCERVIGQIDYDYFNDVSSYYLYK